MKEAPKPKIMSLEECLMFIQHDECLEVTPNRIAMRKNILNQKERENLAKGKPPRGVKQKA